MGFGGSPKSPSFTKDRRAWNAAWEDELATMYGSAIEISSPNRRPVLKTFSDLPTQFYEVMLADAHILDMQSTKSRICILQSDLTHKASQTFAEDDFESHWTTRCSVKEREEFILEGLVRACGASPDFEENRKWCPELTLNRLNHGSGRGFIDLLKKLTFQDLDNIPPSSEPFRTRTGQPPGLSADHGGLNTLLAFHGESEEYGLAKGQREDKQQLKHLKKLFGREVDIKSIINETASKRQLGVRFCVACGLPAEKAGVATLSACQRCKSIGRLTADWKTGHPPHKTICGKKGVADVLLSAVSAASPVADADEPFPPARPGYTRSPALLHQLQLLKTRPGRDYFFVQPDPGPDHSITFQEARNRVVFEMCMKCAVCDHAPREVWMMFQLLESAARGMPSFGVEKLKKQLFKEFGVDVDTAKAEE
ncbi:hypothetical protein DFH09DRAFT_1315753 [Mycena vulgaris]|nr:hypothetical protein DFH09DRAFT_1315753 [Mycena vulgaris]